MVFDYEIVKEITNEDFLGRNRDILSKCKDLENLYNLGQLRSCLGDTREVLEKFMRYLYGRLKKRRIRDADMLGKIINDQEFKVLLNDTEIISVADLINHKVCKYIHARPNAYETNEQYTNRIKYEDEKEVPAVADEVLKQLSCFLRLATNYINNRLSSVRGKIEFSLKEILNEKTKITDTILEAKIMDVEDFRDYKRKWQIDGKEPIKHTGSQLILRKNYIGRVIVLSAQNKKTGQVLVGKFGPIKKEHLFTNGALRSQNLPQNGPLLTANFLEAELAKELLKTQEEYDSED